jgi:hypothetical protein
MFLMSRALEVLGFIMRDVSGVASVSWKLFLRLAFHDASNFRDRNDDAIRHD